MRKPLRSVYEGAPKQTTIAAGSPPGSYISEELAARVWTQAQLAIKMGVSKPYICKLLKGQVHLTQATAVLLSRVFDTQPIYWMNLESQYRRTLESQRG